MHFGKQLWRRFTVGLHQPSDLYPQGSSCVCHLALLQSPGRENELKGHLDAPENNREWLTQDWRARTVTAFAR